MKQIFSELEIDNMVTDLAWRISKDYFVDIDSVAVYPLFLVVANAALPFASDLLKKLYEVDKDFKFYVETINPSSYSILDNQKREVKLDFESELIKERLILIVDTVYDTGETVNTIKELCYSKGAASVETCILIHKEKDEDRYLDYVGATLDSDVFIAGYGLDDKGLCRNLPFIYEVLDVDKS